MKVRTGDNRIIERDRPKWKEVWHIYDYVESVEADYIKELLPIRVAVMSSGEVK